MAGRGYHEEHGGAVLHEPDPQTTIAQQATLIVHLQEQVARLQEEAQQDFETIMFAHETNVQAIAQRDHARLWCAYWRLLAMSDIPKPVRLPETASDGWSGYTGKQTR